MLCNIILQQQKDDFFVLVSLPFWVTVKCSVSIELTHTNFLGCISFIASVFLLWITHLAQSLFDVMKILLTANRL